MNPPATAPAANPGRPAGPVAIEIARRLAALSPTRLEVEDQSDRHVGHAGHDPRGESHFAVTVESAAFAGQSRLARQRMIYAALGELMHGRVHALSIKALAAGEA